MRLPANVVKCITPRPIHGLRDLQVGDLIWWAEKACIYLGQRWVEDNDTHWAAWQYCLYFPDGHVAWLAGTADAGVIASRISEAEE